MRLSSLMRKMVPDKWNGLYDLFSISYFFFLTHYTVHRTTLYYATILILLIVSLKKVHSSFVFIDTFDRAYSFHSDPIYVSHTIHSINTDRPMNECPPYSFFFFSLKSTYCCVHSLARKLNFIPLPTMRR